MTNFEALLVGLMLVLGGSVIAILVLLVKRVISIDNKLSSDITISDDVVLKPAATKPKKEKTAKPFLPVSGSVKKPAEKTAEEIDKKTDDITEAEEKEKKSPFAFLKGIKKEKSPAEDMPAAPTMPVIPPPVVSAPPVQTAPPPPPPVTEKTTVEPVPEPPKPFTPPPQKPVVPPMPVIPEPVIPPPPVFKEEPVAPPSPPPVSAPSTAPEHVDFISEPVAPKLPKKTYAPPVAAVPRIKTHYCSNCGAAYNEGEPCPNGCSPSRR